MNALPEPIAHAETEDYRRTTVLHLVLLSEKKVTFTGKVTFGGRTFDEPQPRPLFYGYTYKKKGLIAFSQIWTLSLLLGENDAFLIQNAPPFLS